MVPPISTLEYLKSSLIKGDLCVFLADETIELDVFNETQLELLLSQFEVPNTSDADFSVLLFEQMSQGRKGIVNILGHFLQSSAIDEQQHSQVASLRFFMIPGYAVGQPKKTFTLCYLALKCMELCKHYKLEWFQRCGIDNFELSKKENMKSPTVAFLDLSRKFLGVSRARDQAIFTCKSLRFRTPSLALKTLPTQDQMASEKQIRQLEEFFNIMDAAKASNASKLLAMYPIVKVAAAIFRRYDAVPFGWEDFSFLTGELMPSQQPIVALASDYATQEILKTEMDFLHTLKEVQSAYLDAVYDVFGSGKTKEIDDFGLSQHEVNQIFEPLAHVTRFSQELLNRLDCIILINDQPVGDVDRAGYVAEAFLEMGSKLFQFVPAVISLSSSLELLQEATLRLTKKRKSAKTFIKLWESVSVNNEVLKSKGALNSILSTPFQRVIRYKMLLEALLKNTVRQASIPKLMEALELISEAVHNINEAKRKHEKLVKFFGTNEGLTAMGKSNHQARFKRGTTVTAVNPMISYNCKITGMI